MDSISATLLNTLGFVAAIIFSGFAIGLNLTGEYSFEWWQVFVIGLVAGVIFYALGYLAMYLVNASISKGYFRDEAIKKNEAFVNGFDTIDLDKVHTLFHKQIFENQNLTTEELRNSMELPEDLKELTNEELEELLRISVISGVYRYAQDNNHRWHTMVDKEANDNWVKYHRRLTARYKKNSELRDTIKTV